MRIFNALLFSLTLAALPASPAVSGTPLQWHPWSQSIFEQAKRENRFVLLDLEAVWCHWCHVMEVTTYSDPAVMRLLQERYILVRVDEDSRPDLANRYEDYGWPATVVFNYDGSEIIKRSGYLPPRQMASILEAIIRDPSPGPSVRPESRLDFSHPLLLNPHLRDELTKDYLAKYDSEKGAWGFAQKYMDSSSEEYALTLAAAGDARAARMGKQTLLQAARLLDPVWGGVYQYSTDGDWNAPHFEKIMLMQAEYMRLYSIGYALWRDPQFLKTAEGIQGFLHNMLTSSEGAFYTSQDADLVDGVHSADYFKLNDAARRAKGIPRIDKHIYARENGWAIYALTTLYAAGADEEALRQATRAANWIVSHRSLPGGGFRHDERDVAGPYLGDTLAMARAFLGLYSVTGDSQWLKRAQKAVDFIGADFRDTEGAGFVTAKAATDRAYKPHAQRDENIMLGRLANLLFHYTDNQVYRETAEQATKYVTSPEIAKVFPTAGALLLDREMSTEPLHVTVVGSGNAVRKQLFQAALAYPSTYRIIEVWDPREGPAPNHIQYPKLDKPAAFVCSNNRCSSPIFVADDLRSHVERFSR